MSATEAVMWKISNDPWLRPVAGTLTVVDRPIDSDLFRRRVRYAVAEIARLRERVEPGPAPWDPPRWIPDRDFDLDYHLRHVALAAEGSMTELQELVSRWYEDPFDPARPLWQFVIVDGVEDGKGALFCKLHHTISDGIGLLRLSERYMDLERDAPGRAAPRGDRRSGGRASCTSRALLSRDRGGRSPPGHSSGWLAPRSRPTWRGRGGHGGPPPTTGRRSRRAAGGRSARHG